MPFHYVLANLLAENPDAVGAIFVDDVGETVDSANSEEGPFDLQVIGAYLGIYLRQTTEAFGRLELDQPQNMHFEQDGLHFQIARLPDEYFLVLMQKSPAVVGRSRYQLERAADQLAAELFP